MRPDLWPKGIIPYEIQPDMPNLQHVEEAIEHWNSSGVPVQLVPRAGQQDYVEFVMSEHCSSRKGRGGGRQEIRLSPACRTGVVLHEIGHATGLGHEHCRHDRDQFLEKIHLENIYPEALSNFLKQPDNGEMLGEYDFDSIMHYSQKAFSRNRGRTIMPKEELVPPGVLIGQRRQLSAGDIQRLVYLYGEGSENVTLPAARPAEETARGESMSQDSSPFIGTR
ncbi:MAG: M12 family metallopeptidase [Pseudonocardiaceae bacterium]